MAAGNIVKGQDKVHGAVDTVDGDIDRISELPDDILVDILERLVMAGDVRTVTRTSILSRRWRFLQWPHITSVALDVGNFFFDSDDKWLRVRRRRAGSASAAFWNQHHATAAFIDALARFLAASPSERVIEKLSLKFILTRRDFVRRIGVLVGRAVDAGAVKNVEFDIVTEMTCVTTADMPYMMSYSKRFTDFLKDCPVAFRSLTRLTLQFLWFEEHDAVAKLVRDSDALEFLSLTSSGLLRPVPEDPGAFLPAILTIDAPRSRLKTLVLDILYVERVELVQAPALVDFQHSWMVFDIDTPPIWFVGTPPLKSLSLGHRLEKEDADVKWKLSELLANSGRIETLRCRFGGEEIWLQPEHPRELRDVLGGLKELHLTKISPGYNLSWTLFLLEAAPLLESLEIHIFDHICTAERRKKHGVNTNLTWQPSRGFMHHNLKQLSFHRAFYVNKDLPFAKRVMELAVDLETLTMGVKSLECKDCKAAELKFPDLARSRLKFAGNTDYVDTVVKRLKDGIGTCAQITILLPE